MYTIGQVSEMFHLPISTLRYYDKEGFFPNLVRKGNIRYFSDNELEALRVIECLKQSGLEIKDIKQFFEWVTEGSSTYAKRKELFEHRKVAVKEEIKQLEKTLAMLEFKCCITIPQWLMATKIELMQCSLIIFQRTFKNFITKLTNNICQANCLAFIYYLCTENMNLLIYIFLVRIWNFIIQKIALNLHMKIVFFP